VCIRVSDTYRIRYPYQYPCNIAHRYTTDFRYLEIAKHKNITCTFMLEHGLENKKSFSVKQKIKPIFDLCFSRRAYFDLHLLAVC